MQTTIPTRDECLFLIEKHGMLPNIVRHSLTVEKVAVFLGHALIKAGEACDLPEIVAGALLHDITKTRSIRTHENHAVTGENLLKELGYHRVAEIVRCHIELPAMKIEASGVSPEELVNYADKRVCQDSVVTLSERFQDLTIRYGATAESCTRLRKLEEQTYCLEAKICARIGFDPLDLPRALQEYDTKPLM
jgi:uncharacterized protein